MELNNITFNKTIGGLGRTLPGQDHVSGMLFWLDSKGSKTKEDTPIAIKSVEELERLGIEKQKRFEGDSGFDENVDEKDDQTIWYHVEQFFGMNPGATLWVEIKTTADSSSVESLQQSANGAIRQIGIYDEVSSNTEPFIGDLQNKATNLADKNQPVSVLYQNVNYVVPKEENTSLLREGKAKYISVLIGQDANARKIKEKIGCIGVALGALSSAAVHENIGWVQKFNLGGHISNPEILIKENADPDPDEFQAIKTMSKTDKSNLNSTGFIFPLQHIGDPGVYFNDSHTCIDSLDDYAYIENNRTIEKAIREIRSNLLPQLNSPFDIDSETGRMTQDAAKHFENLCKQPLERMVNQGELSEFGVKVDPLQVISDSHIEVVMKLVPRGTARSIKVNIGFTARV
ncbi:DUF2586 family protein [Aureibacter tunicatorum]|uniref:DUF2586 family protein n=1 Tax=Aureibacter tunicatorum TaxID=866807 RepID=A0AAE3XSJ3_9BACT|nr:DUF2586 family protein [Aureibacter tunicatorum]MDR6241968.1 hypothetical protein [Aureibacter tunicatorum]BDD07521.1 hypothetical protein AUTU_50040 [Aureibacter tunicatorum]